MEEGLQQVGDVNCVLDSGVQFSANNMPPRNNPKEGFSALDMITFSRQVTLDCIEVVNSKEATWSTKLWAIMRIINNFMNREAFFFVDLAFCLSFCIYNIVTTHVMKALEFYTVGPLVINATFFWYFCYCRYLNGKDVITLRRSIQLLSHSFQLCTIGMLVLCRQEHNNIVDDDSYDGPKVNHHFVCTTSFVLSNAARIVFHFTVLFKSFVDEYLSNFLITRGVLLDLITLLSSPPMIVFCLVTDICAHDVRSFLVKALNVTYEVNDITHKTPFYLSLADSMHRNKLEPVIFFLILLSTDLVVYLELPYEYCERNYEAAYVMGVAVFATMMLLGSTVMCEFFFCKQVKYCTLFIFLTLNVGIRLWIAIVGRTTYLCRTTFHDDVYVADYDDDQYAYSSAATFSYMDIYWKEMATVIISGIVWILFIFDNMSNIRKRHVYVIADFAGFYCYVGVYCPLFPLYQYFIVPVADITGVSAAVDGISTQVSRSISLQIFNSLHVEQATSPQINPDRNNDSFMNV
jgi:hypothetical protein